MSKYTFIKDRLKELGKKQRELAECLKIERTYLNITINKDRELQPREILPTARFLQYDVESFLKYVTGEITDPRLIRKIYQSDQTPTVLPKEDLKALLALVTERLHLAGKDLPLNKKIDLIYLIYDEVKDIQQSRQQAEIIKIIDVLLKAQAVNG